LLKLTCKILIYDELTLFTRMQASTAGVSCFRLLVLHFLVLDIHL